MLSQFLSFVGDFNNEDEDEYDSDSGFEGEDHGVGRASEMDTIRQELLKYMLLLLFVMNRYKERVLQLREELRESETRTQDLNHDYGVLIKEKEDEVSLLRSQVESVCLRLK